MTLFDIRAEYNRLDVLCHVNTQHIHLRISNRMYRTVGCCYCDDNEPSEIVFASLLFKCSDEQILETARHEYAHALVKLRYPQEDHGHDLVWKAAATEVGAKPERFCSDAKVKQLCNARRRKVPYKYELRCNGCGTTWKYKRFCMVIDAVQNNAQIYRCTKCGGKTFSYKTLKT